MKKTYKPNEIIYFSKHLNTKHFNLKILFLLVEISWIINRISNILLNKTDFFYWKMIEFGYVSYDITLFLKETPIVTNLITWDE